MRDEDEAKAAGSDERFAAALDAYGELLRRAVARLFPRGLGLDWRDIEQEARLRLWRAFQDEREIVDLASYVYRIAASVTIDAIRRVKTRREEQLRTEGDCDEEGRGGPTLLATASARSPEREAERKEILGKVEEAMATLPQESRRAVGLYLQGMTSQETADLLGWTEPKTRNITYRALDALRRQLSAWGIEYEIEP